MIKSKIALAAVLMLVLGAASTAMAKPYRASAADSYGMQQSGNGLTAGEPAYGRLFESDVVTFGNRVIGRDPDANIRTQMLHDPVPNAY